MLRRWTVVITAAVMAAVVLAALYLAALFVAHDFNPDFLAIDSCLDAGGQWDYSGRRCVRPSASP